MTMVWTQSLVGGILFKHGKRKVTDFLGNNNKKNNVLTALYNTNSHGKTLLALKPLTLNFTPVIEGSLICYSIHRYIIRSNLLYEVNNQCCACFFSTKTNSAESERPRKVKKTETRKNIDKRVRKQKESASIRNFCLEELESNIKRKRKKYSYVLSESVAEKIVTTVMKHRTNPYNPVLDVRAGPGLVCREFLRQGVSKVVALEMDKDFLPFLSTLQSDVGNDRFSFFNWQMENLYLKLHSPAHNESVQTFQKMESDVAESLMTHQSSTDVPYSLVSVGGKANNEYFMFYVLLNLPNEDPILSHGRVELFFLVHPRFKCKIDYISRLHRINDGVPSVIRDKSSATHFSYIHTLIYLLYDIDVLAEFDADEFCPPFNSIKAKQDKGVDPSKRLLVRMQLKKNIDEILLLPHHIPFLNFLFQVYKKKSVRMIPAMEMLIPGCGLRMLAEGFNMMDTIIMSNPNDFLKLYKMMLQWPEYRSSPLHNYLVMKMTGSTEDGGLSDGEGN